jgi:predicted transcriptional regulator
MTVRTGKERLVFLMVILLDKDLKMITTLKSDVRQSILGLLVENGGLKMDEYAKILGMSYKIVHYHLKTLKEAGAVDVKETSFRQVHG